jgi:hypothetical protein
LKLDGGSGLALRELRSRLNYKEQCADSSKEE